MKTNEIKDKIVAKIAAASEEVSTAVINEFAAAEITKRTKIISDTIKIIGKMELKLTELEVGDIITFSKSGEKDVKYSADVFNQITLLKEGIAKAYEAADKALKENNEAAYENLITVMKVFYVKF